VTIVTIAYPLDVGVISAHATDTDQLVRVSFTGSELQQIIVEVTLAVVDSEKAGTFDCLFP
jgi:hypothetical protein